MFKKLMAMTLVLTMLVCAAPWAGAAASTDKSDPAYHATAAVKARGVLNVALSGESRNSYTIPNDPAKYGDLAGTRDGNVPEMCRRIGQELGVEVKFLEYATLDAQLRAVASGEADLAADNFAHTAERLATYEMSDSFLVGEIGGDKVFLSANPASGIQIQKKADLDGAIFGAVKDTVQVKNITLQHPNATVVELADNQAVLDALAAGQVDAGVFTMFNRIFAEKIMDEIVKKTVIQRGYMVANPEADSIGLILMKGNRDLCQSINTILYNLRESGWLASCCKSEEMEAVQRGIISQGDLAYQTVSTAAADCPSSDFDDLDTSQWYHRYVDYAIEHGLLTGTGGRSFSPDGTLTRAQVVTVLWRMEGERKVSAALNFTDVAQGQWYTEAIRWAVSQKIMEGKGDGTFGPNDPITWEQLAVILYRYAGAKGYDVSAKGDPASYTDASRISSWAAEGVQWACGAKILERGGGGIINPVSSTTRCEFAAVTTHFMENVAAR